MNAADSIPRLRRGPGGADTVVDQVIRREEFQKRYPGVKILSPRENGSLQWTATWTNVSPDPSIDGVVETTKHYELKWLLDYLEARFERGDTRPANP